MDVPRHITDRDFLNAELDLAIFPQATSDWAGPRPGGMQIAFKRSPDCTATGKKCARRDLVLIV
jgi:hypothetical protein